jgi:hypothetical protein
MYYLFFVGNIKKLRVENFLQVPRTKKYLMLSRLKEIENYWRKEEKDEGLEYRMRN